MLKSKDLDQPKRNGLVGGGGGDIMGYGSHHSISISIGLNQVRFSLAQIQTNLHIL